MSLFLRWLLVQVAFAVALVAGWVAYDGELHAAAKVAVAAVLAVYAAASLNAGRAAWRGMCATPFLSLAIRACPMLALLGSVAGFLIAFGGGVEDVQARVLGAGTGLISTFVGVCATLVLMVQAHLLDAR